MLNNKFIKYGIGILLLIALLYGFIHSAIIAYAICVFLIIICLKEYRDVLSTKGIYPHKYLPEAFGVILAYIFGAAPITSKSHLFVIPFVVVFTILSFLVTALMNKKPYMTNTFATIGAFAMMFCALYPLKLIHFVPFYVSNYVVFTFLSVIMLASLAEILVEKFAKNKILLCDELSSKKTMFGILANLIVSIALTIVTSLFAGLPVWFAILFGSLLSASMQLGDLSICFIKKELEIENFGGYFCEYGGFLDSIGVVMFSAPIIFYLFCWFL